MVNVKYINSKTALEKISEYWQSLAILTGVAMASVLLMLYVQSYFVLQKDLNASMNNRNLSMQIYINDEIAKPIKELEKNIIELKQSSKEVELSMNKLEVKMNLTMDKIIEVLESNKKEIPNLAKGLN